MNEGSATFLVPLCTARRKEGQFESQTVPPLSGCVSLGKFLTFSVFSFLSGKVQGTLEQFGFEPCPSTFVLIVENKYIGKIFGGLP